MRTSAADPSAPKAGAKEAEWVHLVNVALPQVSPMCGKQKTQETRTLVM